MFHLEALYQHFNQRIKAAAAQFVLNSGLSAGAITHLCVCVCVFDGALTWIYVCVLVTF